MDSAIQLKLYFRISSKRGTPVKDLRHIERYGLKIVKLKLDVKFFETCANLDICPQFLKFKAPNLKIYRNTKSIVDFQSFAVIVKHLNVTSSFLLLCSDCNR